MTNSIPALKVEQLDPEWTCYVRCPLYGCASRTFACCPEHGREGMAVHIATEHPNFTA